MAATRVGISIERYARTRTFRQLRMETRAWITSFSWPARMLLGGRAKGSTGTGPSPRQGKPDLQAPGSSRGVPSWYRRKSGVKYQSFDLGPLEGERATQRGDTRVWNRATGAIVQGFTGKSGMRGGRGVSKTPLWAAQTAGSGA